MFRARVGLGLKNFLNFGLKIWFAYSTKNRFRIFIGYRALSSLLENQAWAFLGIGLMQCELSIEPGPTGSGLGPFQL